MRYIFSVYNYEKLNILNLPPQKKCRSKYTTAAYTYYELLGTYLYIIFNNKNYIYVPTPYNIFF